VGEMPLAVMVFLLSSTAHVDASLIWNRRSRQSPQRVAQENSRRASW
jgi:hypothetical protein